MGRRATAQEAGGRAAAASTEQLDTNAKPRATIYLAECSYDRKEAGEMLEGDLRRHGYTVLPDQQLPRDEADYVAAVERLLARCQLSIHLVGASYGAVPDGPSQKSVVGAAKRARGRSGARARALPRVIWLPRGHPAPSSAQQQVFIEALHQDAEAQFGADLITGDIEALKNSIHATLKKLEKPEPKQPAAADADGRPS